MKMGAGIDTSPRLTKEHENIIYSPFGKGGLAILPLFGKEGIGEILLNSIIHPSLNGYLQNFFST
jgi:hypothetical protein